MATEQTIRIGNTNYTFTPGVDSAAAHIGTIGELKNRTGGFAGIVFQAPNGNRGILGGAGAAGRVSAADAREVLGPLDAPAPAPCDCPTEILGPSCPARVA